MQFANNQATQNVAVTADMRRVVVVTLSEQCRELSFDVSQKMQK